MGGAINVEHLYYIIILFPKSDKKQKMIGDVSHRVHMDFCKRQEITEHEQQ